LYNIAADHHQTSSSHTAAAKWKVSSFQEMQMKASKYRPTPLLHSIVVDHRRHTLLLQNGWFKAFEKRKWRQSKMEANAK